MSSDQPRKRRQTRRTSRRREFDNTVPSPCVKVCQFQGGDFCAGCYRNQDEIREWMIMSREEKLTVLEKIAGRRADSKT